jgi:hypothetical protein
MDWLSLLFVGLSAGIACGIATLIAGNPKKHRVTFFLILFISFVAIHELSKAYILPSLNAWNNARKVESALIESPVFQVIKKYYPETYKHLLSDFKDTFQKGIDPAQCKAQLRAHLFGLLMKRIPYASDEAVVSYMQVMLSQMSELNKRGGDLCYRFLFPKESGGLEVGKYFSKEIQEADSNAFAQVLKTSAENPQAIPQENYAVPKIEPIMGELAREYGNDVYMLQNPTGPDVDKIKIGLMTLRLYSKILEFPPNESGKILRFMFSQV